MAASRKRAVLDVDDAVTLLDMIKDMPRGLMKARMLPYLDTRLPTPAAVAELLLQLLHARMCGINSRGDFFGEWVLHTPDAARLRLFPPGAEPSSFRATVHLDECTSAETAGRLRAMPDWHAFRPDTATGLAILTSRPAFVRFLASALKIAVLPRAALKIAYQPRRAVPFLQFAIVTRRDPDTRRVDNVFHLLEVTCVDVWWLPVKSNRVHLDDLAAVVCRPLPCLERFMMSTATCGFEVSSVATVSKDDANVHIDCAGRLRFWSNDPMTDAARAAYDAAAAAAELPDWDVSRAGVCGAPDALRTFGLHVIQQLRSRQDPRLYFDMRVSFIVPMDNPRNDDSASAALDMLATQTAMSTATLRAHV